MPEGAFERRCPLKPKFTRDGQIISATSGGLSAEHLGQKSNHLLPFTKSDLVVLREDRTPGGGLSGPFFPACGSCLNQLFCSRGVLLHLHQVDQQVYYCRIVNLLIFTMGQRQKRKEFMCWVCTLCLALCKRDCVCSLSLISHCGKGTEWVSAEILINPELRSNPGLLDVSLPSSIAWNTYIKAEDLI